MKEPGPAHPITITPNPHRVRVLVGGAVVAETSAALTLQEASYPPVQYIPRADIKAEMFTPSTRSSHCPYKGDASYLGVEAGGRVVENVAWSYERPFPAVAAIAGHLAFYPDRVDAIEEVG